MFSNTHNSQIITHNQVTRSLTMRCSRPSMRMSPTGHLLSILSKSPACSLRAHPALTVHTQAHCDCVEHTRMHAPALEYNLWNELEHLKWSPTASVSRAMATLIRT